MIFPSGLTHRFEITANKKLVLEYIDHPTEAVEELMSEIRRFIKRFEVLDEQVHDDIEASHDKP